MEKSAFWDEESNALDLGASAVTMEKGGKQMSTLSLDFTLKKLWMKKEKNHRMGGGGGGKAAQTLQEGKNIFTGKILGRGKVHKFIKLTSIKMAQKWRS